MVLRNWNRFVSFSPEVIGAIRKSSDLLGSKIVLLETALITHGMPYPKNLQMALRLEEIIREKGAIPATVGVISGKLHIGLNRAQLKHLADPNTTKIKVSRRDLPMALASGLTGGTTVSGTLAIAGNAIPGYSFPIFVTGGIGGVHRGVEATMDISADLNEMGKARTMVVSAGVKSILDIGKTLEYLETQGVCVASFGGSQEFPAFFSQKSGFRSPHKIESVSEAAQLLVNHFDLGIKSGLFLAVPIPDSASAEGEAIESAIQNALQEASSSGISGRDVTPFVLSKVNEITSGKSLEANWALLENNADIGGQIAVGVSEMAEDRTLAQHNLGAMPIDDRPRPVVIGGSIIDLVTKSSEQTGLRLDSSTNKGTIKVGFGGVGRNLADAMAMLDMDPLFVSAVGKDYFGRIVLDHNEKLDKRGIKVIKDASTAIYNCVLDTDGEVKLGIGDMKIHKRINVDAIDSVSREILKAPMALIDGNLTPEAIDFVLRLCARPRIPVFFEPTDMKKARKVMAAKHLSSVTYASPNVMELQSMSDLRFEVDKDKPVELVKNCVDSCEELLRQMQVIVVTLGEQGCLVVRRGQPTDPLPKENDPDFRSSGDVVISAKHYPLLPESRIIDSVSGAGDCFAAAFVTAVLHDKTQDQAVAAGFQAATLSLRSASAVPSNLSSDIIDWNKEHPGNLI